MIPTNIFLNILRPLVVAATPGIADAAGLDVRLVMAPFTPSPALVLASLTYATDAWAAAKTSGAPPQPILTDPATNQTFCEVKEPAGGWKWASTAGTYPTTYYGVAVVTKTATVILLGTALFDVPVTITADGQVVEADSIRFLFIPGSMI